MPITNAPFFKYAFAKEGNKIEIPKERDNLGNVSYQEGYTPDYSKNPEEDGKYILRENINQLFFDITNSIRTQQINGANVWSAEVAANGGYPAGAIVYVCMTYNNYSQPESFLVNRDFYMPVCSLKDGNTDQPNQQNLKKTWWVLDGTPLFGTIIRLSNKGNWAVAPDSYLEIGGNNPNQKYLYSDYPRVKRSYDVGVMSDFFIHDNDGFRIMDLRGRFPRLWSNGGSIDNGRTFNNLQGDAMREITAILENTYPSGNLTAITGLSAVSGAFAKISGGMIGYDPVYKDYNFVRKAEFKVSRQLAVTNEIRPYNFNFRMFIKV